MASWQKFHGTILPGLSWLKQPVPLWLVASLALAAPGVVQADLDRLVINFSAACAANQISEPINPVTVTLLEQQARQFFARAEGEPPTGVPHVDQTYELLAEVYHFLQSTLGLDSLDNNGTTLEVVTGVHFIADIPLPQCLGDGFNALWNSQTQVMYLPAAALPYVEVIAHEIAHGVVDNGSDLLYEYQSGAISEALSDAVGVSFRAWRQAGGTASHSPPDFPAFAGLWEIRAQGEVVRNMRQPKRAGWFYPDHYDDYVRTAEDNGGVHINSSILNQAFYLLAEGGQHPRLGRGPTVQGIGIKAAMQIYAQAGMHLLSRRADFEEARYAFAQAAELMFGGKHSAAWIAVHEAMDAVGLPGDWPRQSSSTPPPGPAPTLPPAAATHTNQRHA